MSKKLFWQNGRFSLTISYGSFSFSLTISYGALVGRWSENLQSLASSNNAQMICKLHTCGNIVAATFN